MTQNHERFLDGPHGVTDKHFFLKYRFEADKKKKLQELLLTHKKNENLKTGIDSKHRPYLWNFYTTVYESDPAGTFAPVPVWGDTNLAIISADGLFDITFPNLFAKHGRRALDGHELIATLPDKKTFFEVILDQAESNAKQGILHQKYDDLGLIDGVQLKAVFSAEIPKPGDRLYKDIAMISKGNFVNKK